VRRALLPLWALVASPLLGWALSAAGIGFGGLIVLPPAFAAGGALAARSPVRRVATWAGAALAATVVLVVVVLALSPSAWN
jgi:hypothetical protein